VLFFACCLLNFEIFSAIVGADFSGYSSLSKESGESPSDEYAFLTLERRFREEAD